MVPWPLQSRDSMQNINCFGFVSSTLQTIATFQTPCICNPLTPTLHPTSGVLTAYSAFSTPSLPPALGWIFNLCRRKGGCVGRVAAPISCGENGSQPQSGSWSGLRWATQRQRGPEKKSPGEYAKHCIKETKAQLSKSFALKFKQKM